MSYRTINADLICREAGTVRYMDDFWWDHCLERVECGKIPAGPSLISVVWPQLSSQEAAEPNTTAVIAGRLVIEDSEELLDGYSCA